MSVGVHSVGNRKKNREEDVGMNDVMNTVGESRKGAALRDYIVLEAETHQLVLQNEP